MWLCSVTACSDGPDTSANQSSEAHIATHAPLPEPPKAKTEPHSFTYHGITVEDPWHWLRDDSYPTVDDEDIIAYLEAENRYFEAAMAPQEPLVETIFGELRGRQQEDEASVPSKDGDWFYQWRYPEGGQYRVWSRWPAGDPNGREGPTPAAQVVLDEPALAADVEYFRLGAFAPDNRGEPATLPTAPTPTVQNATASSFATSTRANCCRTRSGTRSARRCGRRTTPPSSTP